MDIQIGNLVIFDDEGVEELGEVVSFHGNGLITVIDTPHGDTHFNYAIIRVEDVYEVVMKG